MSFGRSAFHARLVLLASSLLHGPKTQRFCHFARKSVPSLAFTYSFKATSIQSFATMSPIERVADKLEAPDLDNRSYRVIRLRNKLEALLVHDPDTDKGGAAVNVNVGSFSDADEMPGMAHAVEHLLFMGTKKVCTPI